MVLADVKVCHNQPAITTLHSKLVKIKFHLLFHTLMNTVARAITDVLKYIFKLGSRDITYILRHNNKLESRAITDVFKYSIKLVVKGHHSCF